MGKVDDRHIGICNHHAHAQIKCNQLRCFSNNKKPGFCPSLSRVTHTNLGMVCKIAGKGVRPSLLLPVCQSAQASGMMSTPHTSHPKFVFRRPGLLCYTPNSSSSIQLQYQLQLYFCKSRAPPLY